MFGVLGGFAHTVSHVGVDRIGAGGVAGPLGSRRARGRSVPVRLREGGTTRRDAAGAARFCESSRRFLTRRTSACAILASNNFSCLDSVPRRPPVPPCEDGRTGRLPPITGPCRSPGRSTTTIAGASPIPGPVSGGDILSLMTEQAPRVAFTYCTQCKWLLRDGWMAQELRNTFGTTLGEVSLVTGTGGVFRIVVDDTVVWDRKEDKGFPEIVVLKQRV